VVIAAAVTITAAFTLAKTRFGQHTLGIGAWLVAE
jgi:predicted ABC-type sugar transport system permease subunit